jgi:hypothetical protein
MFWSMCICLYLRQSHFRLDPETISPRGGAARDWSAKTSDQTGNIVFCITKTPGNYVQDRGFLGVLGIILGV